MNPMIDDRKKLIHGWGSLLAKLSAISIQRFTFLRGDFKKLMADGLIADGLFKI
jgi:hypothetical protein